MYQDVKEKSQKLWVKSLPVSKAHPGRGGHGAALRELPSDLGHLTGGAVDPVRIVCVGRHAPSCPSPVHLSHTTWAAGQCLSSHSPLLLS